MTVRVSVFVPSLLRECTGGLAELCLEATTLEQCLERLMAEYPLLQRRLMTESGDLREHVNLFFNDQNLRWLNDWDVSLQNGDTLTIVQNVSGG